METLADENGKRGGGKKKSEKRERIQQRNMCNHHHLDFSLDLELVFFLGVASFREVGVGGILSCDSAV